MNARMEPLSRAPRVCFLVGSAALSGGTYVIFQHASYLRDHGYEVTLAVQEPFVANTLAWHDEGPRLRCVAFEEARREPFDLAIATWWKTALELGTFDAPHHAYFVQSIESRFYPDREGPLRALIAASYRLPVEYVTEAGWIADYLHREFDQKAAIVRNGIRKDIYTSDGPVIAPRPGAQPRILVEGHFNVAFKNTALAIKLARRAGARDVWVMTGSPIGELPGVARVFSRVPIHKTAEIYRSCDILLKLSTVEGMFGPPLEMFHCGGSAVVFGVTGHEEYIKNEMNAVVVPQGDTARVVTELRALLTNRERLSALKKGALDTASRWVDWKQSSARFTEWVNGALESHVTDRNAIGQATRAAWARYGADEKARLRAHPSIVLRYKATRLARKLPLPLQDGVRRARALAEMLVPPRKAS